MKSEKGIWMLKWKEVKGIPLYLFMLYFFFVIFIYIKEEGAQRLNKPSTYVIIILWLLFTFLALLEVERIREFYRKRKIWFDAILLVLSPIVSFLMVETMVSNFNMDMFKSYSSYNLIWYIAIYYFAFTIIRSSKVTIILCNISIYIASLVNYFVYLFRGNPILPSDLLAWRTGMSVASSYEIRFTQGFLISTLLMFILFTLAFQLEGIKKKPTLINRVLVMGSFIGFWLVVYNAFFETDLIKSKIRVIDFFAPKYTYCSYGTVFGFVANVQAMETNAPEGYSLQRIEEILQEAEEEKEITPNSHKPNIIVIMNEAFSDLSLIGDFSTNMDYLPFIRSMEENTVHGNLHVSVYGGATSNTEYEFLTGNSMAVMPQNSVPYQQFITEPTNSLAATLKEQGYYNVALHPYAGSGYKRDLVYPLLGFDDFLSIEDFHQPSLIRSFVSDRESYDKIIEVYEKKEKDSPLFVFNVTMQNHGGYSDSQLFPDDETIRFTDETGFGITEQYLSLLKKSDEAFSYLIDYFSKQSEETIILLFGDHQPIAYSQIHDFLEREEELSQEDALRRKYLVPFVLWANYEIPEDTISDMSVNYLSSFLIERAGLVGSAYNKYLMDMYEEIPVITALYYMDKNRALYKYSEDSMISQRIKEYQYIGYNNALDEVDKLRRYYSLNGY